MEKFEQDIEKKLTNFSIEPSAQVWLDVEAALHERTKRRFIAWWWLPITGILLLSVTWWLLNNHTQTNTNKTNAITFLKNTNTEVDTTKNTVVINNKQLAKNSLTIDAEKQMTARKFLVKKNKEQKNIAIDNKEKKFAYITNARAQFVGKSTNETKNSLTQNTLANKQQTTQQQNIDLLKTTKIDTLKKVDSSQFSSIKIMQHVDSTKDSLVIKKLPTVKLKGKKHAWYLTAGGGVSVIGDRNFLASSSSVYNSILMGSPSVGPSGGGTFRSKLPLNGFFFLVGADYERQLNKHFSGALGLHYRYIQNNEVKDTLNAKNYVHWLQLPLNIQYTINPTKNYTIQFQAGGSVAWAFAEKWKVLPATGYSYYNATLNNKFIFNVDAGISVQEKHGYKFSLVAEQSITPIHKNNDYKYYWQQYSLQLKIPVNFIQKSK